MSCLEKKIFSSIWKIAKNFPIQYLLKVLFADGTTLFSVVKDILSQIVLNEHLTKINNSAYQWKISSNLDSSN